MVQMTGLGEALRCLFLTPLGGRNLAMTLDRLSGRRFPHYSRILRPGVLPYHPRCAAVHWQGPLITGMASARARSGPGAWEIDRLYLRRPTEKALVALLENLAQRAGQQGAMRIFLRVPAGSWLEDQSRSSGFSCAYQEGLMEGCYRDAPAQPLVHDRAGVRAAPHHQYGIFQLYCASTPMPVRRIIGVTFDEWSECRERIPGRQDERVFEVDGRVRGWLCIGRSPGVTQCQVMVHPDEGELLSHMVRLGLSSQGKHVWLVPGYQESLSSMLTYYGFKEVGRYSVLVNPTVATQRDTSWAATEVVS